MNTVYRAVLDYSGEILERDSGELDFKHLYRIALRHVRDDIYLGRANCLVIRFQFVRYSEDERINRFGYPQHDIVECETLAYVAVSKTGLTVVYGGNIYEIEKGV